ncbi:MAG TPA: peptide deformylase [Synergistaceae bacterium]|nr:peptide deformylase [Synergistales bacterium]HAG22385.1 peptide deformylase [Synergistaceae bacterium]
MAVLPIHEYPDSVLREAAKPVERFDDELKAFLEDMWETMKENDGVGLAAPQVGVDRQIAVVQWQGKRYVLINPRVVYSEGKDIHEEGCLSAPGVYEEVARPTRIVVEAQDEEGNTYRIEEEGFMARALAHEIDHLQGRLFFDRLSPIKRQMVKRKLQKNRRRG